MASEARSGLGLAAPPRAPAAGRHRARRAAAGRCRRDAGEVRDARELAKRLARAKAEVARKTARNRDDLPKPSSSPPTRWSPSGAASCPRPRSSTRRPPAWLLSGRTHRVYSAVCLVTPADKLRERLVETRLRFKRLSREELESYLASGEWRGKAGGYAIQGLAGTFAVKLVGSYTNVVGLPLYETVSLLDGEGYPVRFRGSTRPEAMNVALWLERAGRADPQRPAIGYGRRVVRTYGELAGRAARLAAAMRGTLGLAAGERVAVIAKNCPDYVEALYGIWWAGLAAVPVNAKLHGAEFAYMLEHSGARVCFATADLESDLAAHAPATLERLIVIGTPPTRRSSRPSRSRPAERAPGDLAWLFYTSGTTGRPKGAMLTHGNIAAPPMPTSPRSIRPRRRRPASCRADEPRLRPLHHAAVMRRGKRGAGIRRLRPDEIFESFGHWRRMRRSARRPW